MNIIIREKQPGDESIIYSTWSKNRWYSSGKHQKPLPDKQKWFKAIFSDIDAVFKSGNLWIACSEDDPDFIVGYLAMQDQKPIWVYVKEKYRKQGIATLLRKKAENTYGKGHDGRTALPGTPGEALEGGDSGQKDALPG